MLNAVQFSDTSQTRLSQIADESHWRQNLDSFVNIIKQNCQIASFYETALTRRLVQVGDHIYISKLSN